MAGDGWWWQVVADGRCLLNNVWRLGLSSCAFANISPPACTLEVVFDASEECHGRYSGTGIRYFPTTLREYLKSFTRKVQPVQIRHLLRKG